MLKFEDIIFYLFVCELIIKAELSWVDGVYMIPKPEQDSDVLLFWVENLKQDPVVMKIIESKVFSRLKEISFLGALDYISATQGMKKKDRTRADHSLNVAGLANFVATKRGYGEDLKRHLIVAGLLHDIGHPPLSHSAEPYFKERFGFGHHEMGEMLLSGKHHSGKELSTYLKERFDINFIESLLDKRVPKNEGGDLFSSPVNIDTIEGITRTYKYMSGSTQSHDPLKYAKASFLESQDASKEVLDGFWLLKDFVYSKFINSNIGIAADKLSQLYFANGGLLLSEEEVFESERIWKRKYKELFLKLNNIAHKSSFPDELQGVTVVFYNRKYSVNNDKLGDHRYEHSKTKCQFEFSVQEKKEVGGSFFLQGEFQDGKCFSH